MSTPLPPNGEVSAKHLTIAIDGPAASGKTTVGRLLASRLGLRFLDTGTMYRALAWCALHEGVSLSDGPVLRALAYSEALVALVEESWEEAGMVASEHGRGHKLYTPAVDAAASQVAQWREVREALVQKQQDIAAKASIVMVGRDIGTKVAPQADLKVFLMASAETRARRRMLQMGNADSLSQVLAHITERDERDTQRSHSPLVPAKDAHRLDTEEMDAQQAVDRIMGWLGAC